MRRSRTLVLYWETGRLVLENYLTRKRRLVGPGIVNVLDQAGRWQSRRSLLSKFPREDLAQIRRAIDTLITGSFLQTTNKRRAADRQLVASWDTWHPAASFFHFATKNAPFPTNEKGHEEVEKNLQARMSKRPSAVKRYRGLPTVALPSPETAGEFPQVLLRRRTWRQFGSLPLDLQSLSTLLALSFGVQWKVRLDVVGTVSLTTSPSGGARHPLETYLIVQRVSGLASGLYHYQSDTHRLTRLSKPARREIVSCFPGQSWCAKVPVIVFLTAVFRRTQWKYPDPQAYRVLLAEAGHVCQTFCLASTWLGLAPYCTMALADSIIEKNLGIDGISESILYAAGVGRRPKARRWAPWPDREELPMPKATGVFAKKDLPPLKAIRRGSGS